MESLLSVAIKASIAASIDVLRQYTFGFKVNTKSDGSPVTTADLLANERLQRYLLPTGYPLLSEESEDAYTEDIVKAWDIYWCIDPIDGTKEFVKKNGQYCISIGLISNEKNTSILGVLSSPSVGKFYFSEESLGSYRWDGEMEELFALLNDEKDIMDKVLAKSTKLKLTHKGGEYICVASISHLTQEDEEYFEELAKEKPTMELKRVGSILKAGILAEGIANEYTRHSRANFWDIAGGHAILKYAGLQVLSLTTQKEIEYSNFKDLRVDPFRVRNI